MTVYLDIVFFENLFMNFCIIYCASILSNKKSSIYKMFVGATLGALYYIAILLPQAEFLTYTIFKIFLSIIIVAISFKYVDIYSFVHDLLVFLVVSFVFGGIMYGMYFFVFNKLTIPYYPVKLIIFGAITAIILLKLTIYRIRCNMEYRKITYMVELSLNGKTKKIKGFLDTGNCLKDPITNVPILLVNYYGIKDILPEDINCACKNNLNSLTNLTKES